MLEYMERRRPRLRPKNSSAQPGGGCGPQFSKHTVFRKTRWSSPKQAPAPQAMIAKNSAGRLPAANVEQMIDGAEYVLSAGGVLHERVRQLSVSYAGRVGYEDLCLRIGIFERAGQHIAINFRHAEAQYAQLKFLLLNGRGCGSVR